ncbi:DUF4920 domain-containing protein [Salinimicrobium flavum]|uniref:DUF4920 domain-containing protein n=1 Tax=Salinimicrobium flavum TaxID=1737065 RepID=A0ABW5J0L2_9FLAO
MKKTLIFLLFMLFLNAGDLLHAQDQKLPAGYSGVGEKFELEHVFTAVNMQEKYNDLKPGDTLNISFKADVASVCKNKGCWMRVDLQDGREVMVKFKDYAFFVPKDIEEKEVILNGKAFVEEVSVEEQRHYAEDAGKTIKEVEAIVEPEITLSFLADGVLIEE